MEWLFILLIVVPALIALVLWDIQSVLGFASCAGQLLGEGRDLLGGLRLQLQAGFKLLLHRRELRLQLEGVPANRERFSASAAIRLHSRPMDRGMGSLQTARGSAPGRFSRASSGSRRAVGSRPVYPQPAGAEPLVGPDVRSASRLLDARSPQQRVAGGVRDASCPPMWGCALHPAGARGRTGWRDSALGRSPLECRADDRCVGCRIRDDGRGGPLHIRRRARAAWCRLLPPRAASEPFGPHWE